MRKSTTSCLICILLFGSFIRFIGGGISFFDDEADFLVLIHSIDFQHFHFPLASVGHSPLSLYITKLSSLLFTEAELGYRFILLIVNSALIWLIYILARQKMGEREGLFAAFLIAFNSFIIYYSREIGCDGYFLLFCALVIYYFFKATETNKERYMIICGLLMGLSLLNKMMSLLLVPGFVLYLLINKEQRGWFKRKSLYLAVLISIIVVSPYLYWLYTHEWTHLKINEHYFEFFNLPMSAVVFLGSLVKVGIYPSVNAFGREYMSLGMGILLIVGVIGTLHRFKDNHFIQLMQLIFWSIIGISLTFFRGWPVHYNACVIPAVLLTAAFLNRIWEKGRLFKWIILVLFAAHLLQIPSYLSKIEVAYDHHSSLSTHSELFPEDVNLNDISSAIIPLLAKYQPTLVVTPNPEWDTVACYLGANTGIKTLAPIPLVYDLIEYEENDWRRILIIDDNQEALMPFVRWIKSQSVYNVQVSDEMLTMKISQKVTNIPIAVVFLSVNQKELDFGVDEKTNEIADFILNIVNNVQTP